MNTEQQKQYIIDQRNKGVSDEDIFQTITSQNTLPQQRSFSQELVPTAFSIGGGIVGGVVGAGAGGVGAIPGAAVGATAGGALGETIQQGIEKRFGQRQSYNTPQIVGQAAISGLTEGVGGLAFKGGQLALKASRPTIVKMLSKVSGFADEVVARALQRTPGAVEAIQQGEVALKDLVIRVNQGIQKLASQTLKESKAKIAEFSKMSTGGAGLPGTRRGLLEDALNFTQKTISSLRRNYNIGVNKEGILQFARNVLPSRIVSGSDKSAIQEGFNVINSIKNNTTINHIDAVLERLMVLKSKTPSGTPTGGETKKIIGEMLNNVVKFVQSLPKKPYGPTYSQYADFLKENLPKRVMLNEAKEIFGSTSNLSAREISKIETTLLQLYNSGKMAFREGVEKIGQEVGEDPLGTISGTLIKAGDEVSARAKNLTTRGIIEKVAEFIPREAVKGYIATGKITGGLLSNPTLKAIAKTTGLSIKALVQQVANLMANKTSR